MNLWWTVRSKTGIAAMSLGVLAVAGLAAGVPALTATPASSQTSEGAYVVPADTPAATTTPPAVPAPEPAVAAPTTSAPVAQPAAKAPAATVNTVTEPAAPAPAVVDPQSIGTTGPDGNYTPAPPRINPGEPPLAPNWGGSGGGDVAPLPGEPGYDGHPAEALPTH